MLLPQRAAQTHAKRSRNGKIKVGAVNRSAVVLKILVSVLLFLTVYAFWSFDCKEIQLGEAIAATLHNMKTVFLEPKLSTDTIQNVLYQLLVTFCLGILSTIFGAVLAALIERIAYQPLLNKGVKRIYLLIAGLGISIIGENLIVVMIDGRFHAYKTSLSAMPVSILGASIGVVDLIILVASAIALLSVQFLIRKTRVGLAIRGAAFDLTTASIMGINVRQLILIVFIIAGSMAGLSGVFLGIKYTAYPTMGNLTNKAFISAVVGGLGSMPGAVVGALILGVLETMISAYVSSALRNLFAYALLIVILLIKPTGLMGKSMEDKA